MGAGELMCAEAIGPGGGGYGESETTSGELLGRLS